MVMNQGVKNNLPHLCTNHLNPTSVSSSSFSLIDSFFVYIIAKADP